MYGLRKINMYGVHHGFRWPLVVGATAICPDWNPEPECGRGLHLLPEGIGDYNLLDGHYWCVVEFDETKMVMIDDEKAKVPECKIVYLSESPNGLAQYFDFDKFDSRTAYQWARDIGNQDTMIDRITESIWAFNWAYRFGNKDIMIDKISDSEGAYFWARDIGNKDIMIDRITESSFAYAWAAIIGNQDTMIDRITESKYAYYWARQIGNKDIMIDRITESKYAYYWARDIGNQDIMIERFPELKEKF